MITARRGSSRYRFAGSKPVTFNQYLAAFALGRVRTSDLPDVGTQALEEDYNSVDLAALAGSRPGERSPSELEELFRRGLRQLGISLPSRVDAGRVLTQYYASLVASGALAPRTGAFEIARLATELADVLPTREFVGDALGVARLLGIYYSHDDVPDGDERARAEIDAELMAECRRLSREGAA